MVASYSVQTEKSDASINGQFAVLMIQNANLSNDTRSSLIFKLTTDNNLTLKLHLISIFLQLLKKVSMIVNDTTVSHLDIKNVRKELDRVITWNHSTVERVNSLFDLDMGSSTLRQTAIPSVAKLHKDTALLRLMGSILGNKPYEEQKRRPQKRQSGCSVCSSMNHWWKENPKCKEHVERKSCFETPIARQMMRPSPVSKSFKVHPTMLSLKSRFFVHGISKTSI